MESFIFIAELTSTRRLYYREADALELYLAYTRMPNKKYYSHGGFVLPDKSIDYIDPDERVGMIVDSLKVTLGRSAIIEYLKQSDPPSIADTKQITNDDLSLFYTDTDKFKDQHTTHHEEHDVIREKFLQLKLNRIAEMKLGLKKEKPIQKESQKAPIITLDREVKDEWRRVSSCMSNAATV